MCLIERSSLYFFNISLLNSPLQPLTYCYEYKLDIGKEVQEKVRNRTLAGVVIDTCEEPSFNTSPIDSLTSSFFSLKQIKSARFIDKHYYYSLGEALNLFTPFSNKERAVDGIAQKNNKSKILLSKQQDKALEFLQQHPVSLLFGDTGSGKTEIYMK